MGGCGGGVGGYVGEGIEGRAQNIAPLQVNGIVAIDAIDAIDAIEAIDAIGDMGAMGFFGVRRGTFGGRRVFWARGRARGRTRGRELVCWMGV